MRYLISMSTYHYGPDVTPAVEIIKEDVEDNRDDTVEEDDDAHEDVELGGGFGALEEGVVRNTAVAKATQGGRVILTLQAATSTRQLRSFYVQI